MNKKDFIFIFFSFLILFITFNPLAYAEMNSNDIPKDAIRLRILANSDSPEDQLFKREIRDNVNAIISTWVSDLTTNKDARDIIKARLNEIEMLISQELEKRGMNQAFRVEFGQFQFPTKLYGNKVYPAGTYEALLITLGDGKGENWWCVLFPPLCYLDFNTDNTSYPLQDKTKNENEVDEKDSTEQPEVNFLIINLFNESVKKVKSWFS